MRHTFLAALALTAAALLATAPRGAAQAQQQWGTIKGRVVWAGDPIPDPKEIPVPPRQAIILANHPNFNAARNVLKDDVLVINPKNKGVKNVFVYLLEQPHQPLFVHPNLKQVPRQPVVVDVTGGVYSPRCAVVRQGQEVHFRNNAEWDYNVRWMVDPERNEGGSVVIAPKNVFQLKDLKAQRLPLAVGSQLHGWANGRLAVVNHPYAVLTDDDGNFEIPNVPAGVQSLMIYHEEFGYRLGAPGKKGEPVTVPANGTVNLGDLAMGK